MNDIEEMNNIQNNEINDNWLSGVSEDLRGNESLGRFKNIDDLAKNYLEIKKTMTNASLFLIKKLILRM